MPDHKARESGLYQLWAEGMLHRLNQWKFQVESVWGVVYKRGSRGKGHDP
jgi:hypothetical protein